MSQIQEIKQAVDIVQLINERVPLQRSGTNWRGLCPFHAEKSPSFFVSEQLQRYKCFGCNESGDVFTFLEKYDGMTFAEVLEYLADRAGIILTKQSFNDEDQQRKRLLELLNLTKEYYHYLLTQHDVGKKALAYLNNRGVTQESIKIFQIGYALSSWDGLSTYLHNKKQYTQQEIQAAGLSVVGKVGRTYDRFRDRIMFPLTDHRGRVVGFSGRVLDPAAKEAKYINTPETPLYHKSQLLFGFSHLYQQIRQENEVIIVEGEFDVISSAQAHVNHAVAVKGSALTEDHLRLLSRTVERILLCFDTDAAGVEATRRAITVAQPFGIELRVLDFGEYAGKDPDELARTNPPAWRQVAKSSISVYEFLLRAAVKRFDPETPEGKRKIVDQLAPVFTQISHAVERDYYVRKLAEMLHVKEAALLLDIQRFGTVKGRTSTAAPKASQLHHTAQTSSEPDSSRQNKFERYLAFLMLHATEQELPPLLQAVIDFPWMIVGMKQIVAKLVEFTATRPWSLQEFSKDLPEDLQQIVFDLSTEEQYLNVLLNLDRQKEYAKEWQKTLAEIQKARLTDEVNKIQTRLDELDMVLEKSHEQELEQIELLQKVVALRQS